MNNLLTALRVLTADLDELKVRWCLVGGMALSVYCEPRTTKDFDVAVHFDSEAALERLIEMLSVKGYHSRQLLMHTMPTFRMGWRALLPATSVPCDFLAYACGIEKEIIESSVRFEILPTVTVPVATLGNLVAMKVLSQNESDRLQDRVDLKHLLSAASKEDLRVARKSIALIATRGFSRGRNLELEFTSFLEKE